MFKYAFELKPSYIYWCTTNCDWIAGHSYTKNPRGRRGRAWSKRCYSARNSVKLHQINDILRNKAKPRENTQGYPKEAKRHSYYLSSSIQVRGGVGNLTLGSGYACRVEGLSPNSIGNLLYETD
ncbi:hypothetical protein Fmac_028859 [Flemingia macrophylla]|uniref:Uncharacterized protein n=1 Tax=Flemingia macrophylla TaxID=520843 RepID=A0ABD1L8P7_9FABA